MNEGLLMSDEELAQCYNALSALKDPLESVALDKDNPARVVAAALMMVVSLVLDNRGILDDMRGVNDD